MTNTKISHLRIDLNKKKLEKGDLTIHFLSNSVIIIHSLSIDLRKDSRYILEANRRHYNFID